MRWIGQHIWNFISRFRTTVYIENLETSSEENVLVVDSDGKVTKNTTLGGSDVTMTNGADNRIMTATGAAAITGEDNLTWDGNAFTIESSATARPIVRIKDTANHAKPPSLMFIKDKGAAGVNSDSPGIITFQGDNAGEAAKIWAQIGVTAMEVTSSSESGQIDIGVITSNGVSGLTANGFRATGSSSAFQVDTTIGYGTSSTATVAGDLDIDGDAITSASNLTITPGGTLELDSTGSMVLDSSANIELNADGGSITFKDDTATLATIDTNGISFIDNTAAGVRFEGTTDDAYSTTLLATDPTGARVCMLPDTSGTLAVLTDIPSVPTQVWHHTLSGYKTNLNNTTGYYFQYRNGNDIWNNFDSSPSSLTNYDSYAGFFIAPRAGTITNVKITGYTSFGTGGGGSGNEFAFYFKKAAIANDTTGVTLTDMFNTSDITPSSTINRTFSHTEDFSSNNAFAEDDMLYCFLRKTASAGATHFYFTLTISGEY